VVDPDPGVAELIARHLTAYEVVGVSDATRLDEEIALHRPRAVVDNQTLNVQPGDSIRLAAPIPILQCSLPSRTWTADDLQVAACLHKPIAAEQLEAELHRLGTSRDVLIIDDDRGFVQLVERMLQAADRGYRPRRAYGGEEGLEAMRQNRPGVVLLDLIMPGMDGFQVLAEMRRDPALAGVPVVLLTATNPKQEGLSENRIIIGRSDGLRITEVLRCLEAVIPVVEPHYDDRETLERAPEPLALRSLSPDNLLFG
jgi:CheY-like chemotaxis protein